MGWWDVEWGVDVELCSPPACGEGPPLGAGGRGIFAKP
jgi:hypothetical protein